MIYQKIKVERTARFILLGEITKKTKNIWVCFHGYGQLASHFGKKFQFMTNEETAIIIPEGLSRFYLNDSYQRIGASWITREMKDEEAEDYIKYLNTLFHQLTKEIDIDSVKINILGFSQGCTTACRWLNQTNFSPQHFVIWAGYFGNGIEDVISIEKLSNTATYFVYGNRDIFFLNEPELKEKMLLDFQEKLPVKIIEFDGEHRVSPKILKELIAQIS